MDSISTVLDKGIFYFNYFYSSVHVFHADVHMFSPPHTSPQIYSSSRITGGILHGHALGNTLNAADHEDVFHDTLLPISGKVLIYYSEKDPADLTIEKMKPTTFIKHQVTSSIQPVLTSVAEKYSPIQSKYLVLIIRLKLTSCD